MTKEKVVIIGSGIGGLGAANLLAKAGYDVHVYEQHTAPGGRAGVIKKDGFTFDSGPSWYLMPEVFEHFYNLLDTSAKAELDIVQLTPAYKVFFEKHDPIQVLTKAEEDKKMFESLESGAGTLFESYIQKSDIIYSLAMQHFLYTNFVSVRDFLKVDILKNTPALLKMAFTSMDRCISQSFKSKQIKQILEYPMVFLGTSPFDAPAIYTLMSSLDYTSGVFYPRGGMYTIIDSLVSIGKRLGVTYHYDSPVASIVVENKHATAITLESGKLIHADIVISNADLYFTETKLLPPSMQTYPEKYWKKREAGPSALLLYLGMEGKLSELEHHNLFFADEWRQNFEAIYKTKTIPETPSIYVSKTSQTDSDVAPRGHEALFMLVPLPSGLTLSFKEQDELADRCITQFADMSGIADLERRIVSKTIRGPAYFADELNAWENTALGPAHTLRQSAVFRTKNKSKKVENLYYVGGSTLPGIGLPMCLISAELVYKHLAGDTKSGRVASIQPIGEKNA